MSEQILRPRVGVGVYVFKDGKLLLGERTGSHGAGEYASPGGHLEYLESFAQCAEDEVFEETGMRINNIRFLRVMNLTAYRPKHYVDISLLADWVSGEPIAKEPDKIKEWKWYDLSDLPSPLFGTMATAIEALKSGQIFWDATEGCVPRETAGHAPSPLKIYFATAIRGGASFDTIKRRVEFLETIGVVTTRHMVSPEGVDLGEKDDGAIYAHDQSLLEESHVFIADASGPSTGTGFMAARALIQGKPVLCLYNEVARPSAMIAGCPEISTRVYTDEASLEAHVRTFLLEHEARFVHLAFSPYKIYLAGPPGSGKGTLAKSLAKKLGLVHVSTGDVLRELVAQASHPLSEAISNYMRAGELVPAQIMRSIVIERLRRADCRLFGFILDGYPPSKEDLLNLQGNEISPDLVLYLDCEDTTAANRQVRRNERSTDTSEKAERRLEVFHAAHAEFPSIATDWYPNDIVVRINAEYSPDAVERFALESLEGLFGPAVPAHSFFPIPAYRPEDVRSTRLHFHIDAPDAKALRAITRRIYAANKGAQGQMKIYPIQHLALGPQVEGLADLYDTLPNFHPITNAQNEAFVTGRLGDGDPELMSDVLTVALAQGGMVELEEYIGEWTLKPNGSTVIESSYEPLEVDMRAFAAHESFLCKSIPPLELHLGFNLPKKPGEALPIPLAELMAACTAEGMENGGWFVFTNEEHWAYRSNEFSPLGKEAGSLQLLLAANALQRILAARGINCDVSFSLEIVHGIWVAKT
ncbi:nucleoside monophosphate kinase [Patescibacteria group bacterium]|nr:nucleoside monophosphate kinase [Patescibacteria group bacterium]